PESVLAGIRGIIPVEYDHVFGYFAYYLGIVEQHVSPHHDFLFAAPQMLYQFPDEIEVQLAFSYIGSQLAVFPPAEVESLIAADVELVGGEQRYEFVYHFPDACKASGGACIERIVRHPVGPCERPVGYFIVFIEMPERL